MITKMGRFLMVIAAALFALLWTFGLAIMLTGCGGGVGGEATYRRLTDPDVRIALGKIGLRCEAGEVSPDAVYWAPQREWFLVQFPQDYRRFLDALQRAGFKGPGDCDDWSRSAALCAQMVKPSMAVGEYMFHTKAGTLHALNVVLVHGHAGIEVLFWEPQTKKLVQLTDNETKNGCIAWRM